VILLVGGAVLPNISKSMSTTTTGRNIYDEVEQEAMNAPFARVGVSSPTETSSSTSSLMATTTTTTTTIGRQAVQDVPPGESPTKKMKAGNPTDLRTEPDARTTNISAAQDTNQPQKHAHEQNEEVVVQVTGETKEVPTTATANVSSENNDSDDETNKNRKKPLNILILYPDDWRHDTIGKENSIVQTPFLDSLADLGIRFRQNAVTSSICWVSRATLFTGQWLSRHQSPKLFCPHFSAGYLWNATSWPGILRQHGYYIGHVVCEK
jgi:Sulfatase